MHRAHDPKYILAFFIVVGGFCLAIRLDQRGPGPHCEAGHARSHASSAQEPYLRRISFEILFCYLHILFGVKIFHY